MSTWWFFQCLDHDPPLQSADEFTQHTEDRNYWDAVRLAHQRPLPENLRGVDYFDTYAYQFLVQHPRCNVALVNEYGEERPLPDTP